MKRHIITRLLIMLIFLVGVNSMAGAAQSRKATFAGGCFWCMEPPFEKLYGVIDVVSGYTGGHVERPTYKQVSAGGTGHLEAVEITYDPAKVSYETLLKVFWKQIDPTDAGGQFVDRGPQYRSAIFYHDRHQQVLAERSKKKLAKSGRFHKPIVTEIVKAGVFYQAEEYHQDYYSKNPIRYAYYRRGSGRDTFLDKVWGKHRKGDLAQVYTTYKKPGKNVLKSRLTTLQYQVTQENSTEPPFKNQYWDNKQEGIYVDIVSGEVLFSSKDKFKSGTGWPSFIRPLEAANIVEKKDTTFGMTRTEVRSRYADSHLGHVFNDGPKPTGLRYCINSAALRFIPKEDLKKEGYKKYEKLFK